MKVLLVNGSPHKNGCTNAALEEIAKTLKEEGIEAEIYHVGVKPIVGCMGCYACHEIGKCVINDSVNEFVEKAKDYDGFVFGSPVHYAAACGSITSFMDRVFFVASGHKEVFIHKPAAAVVSARRAGATAALDQLNKYFLMNQMPVIAGRYWNMVHGAVAEEVKQDIEGMQNMRFLARNMAWHLKCLEAGKKAGVPMPKEEKIIFTNFIRRENSIEVE